MAANRRSARSEGIASQVPLSLDFGGRIDRHYFRCSTATSRRAEHPRADSRRIARAIAPLISNEDVSAQWLLHFFANA
jgi:hypothetical protein